MEGQDVFTQSVEIGNDDPFTGTDFGDFGQPEDPGSFAPENGGEPTSELPVVDREGQPVQHEPQTGASVESQGGSAPAAETQPAAPQEAAQAPQSPAAPQGLPTLSPEQQAAEAAAYREEKGEPAPDPTPASSPAPEAQGAVAERVEPESEAGQPDGTPSPLQPGVAPEVAEGDQGDPTPRSSEPQPTEPTSAEPSAAPSAAEEPEDAPPPAERKTQSGKVTGRRYVLLKVDGPGKFTQLHWYVNKDGAIVEKSVAGAKRQTIVVARGAEDALKIGFAAAGSPQDGVTIVAVAELHFQPKKVRPKPPEPLKTRLDIS